MFEQNSPEHTSPEATPRLQSRPVSRSKRGPAILLLLGGVLIIAVGAIVAWQVLFPPSAPTSLRTTKTGTPAAQKGSTSQATPPGWNDPALYWQTIREQVAQGLHLSVAQVTTKLQAAGATSTAPPSSGKNGAAPDPGTPMTAVAVQQGISTDQLRTIELNALQRACDVMVAQGKLAQTAADQRMQTFRGFDQGTLNWYVMHAFTNQ